MKRRVKDGVFCAGGLAVLAGTGLYSAALALVLGGLVAIVGSVIWHLGEN